MIVHTLTGSIYEIDLDNNTVIRNQGNESGELRRDGDVVSIISIPSPPTIGKPLVMVLDVRGDGVQTVRTTSRVTRIETFAVIEEEEP
jgi:hypothetical protein